MQGLSVRLERGAYALLAVVNRSFCSVLAKSYGKLEFGEREPKSLTSLRREQLGVCSCVTEHVRVTGRVRGVQ